MTLPVLAERGKFNWGKPFKDEVNSKSHHSGRGVISIVNSRLLTNGSQFFITYKSQNHLNLKHTVLDGVFGGMMMLTAMEKFLVDDDDQPLASPLPYRIIEGVNISKVTVFVNPSPEPDEEEENENAKEEEATVDKDNMGFPVICFISSFILVTIKITDYKCFQDKVGSCYGNPGSLTTDYASVGGGDVGKYLKCA